MTNWRGIKRSRVEEAPWELRTVNRELRTVNCELRTVNLQKRVVPLFFSDRCLGTVAGKDPGLFGKHEYLGLNILDQFCVIPSREVGAPYASCEQCVPTDQDVVLG